MEQNERDLISEIIEEMNWLTEEENCCHCHPEYRYVNFEEIDKVWAEYDRRKAAQ